MKKVLIACVMGFVRVRPTEDCLTWDAEVAGLKQYASVSSIRRRCPGYDVYLKKVR